MSGEAPTKPATNCERAIDRVGWGLYHYFMIGMASACAFSQAAALVCIPFAVPLAVCDMNNSETMITNIDFTLSLGMAIGGFFISSASDITGRKCVISTSLLIMFGSTFSCGFAHDPLMILIFMFFLGAGLTANASCVKIHLGEILPTNRRGFCLTFPDLFWTVGYILSAGTAWLLTPSIVYHQARDMRVSTWRIMFGMSGACSIMVACATALAQPSPRYLLFAQKYSEALDTLKHIYAVNNSRHYESYTIRREHLEGCVDDLSILNDQLQLETCSDHILFVFRRTGRLIMQLLKRRFIRVTTLLIFIKLLLITGILATNIWLAKMLQYPNKNDCSFTITNMLHLAENSNKCKFNVHTPLYRDFFLISLNILVGQILLLLVVDRIGRRISIVSGCLACGACSFALGYINNTYSVQLAASSVFMMAYSLVDSAVNIVMIEAYPTGFRGTASGGTQFLGRFASAFVIKFWNAPCHYTFIFIGSMMLGAAILSCFLPEYRDQPMEE